jgi:hypothetical protein
VRKFSSFSSFDASRSFAMSPVVRGAAVRGAAALLGLAATPAALAGCGGPGSSQAEGDLSRASTAIVLDTSTPLAQEQHDANVAFARDYAPKCAGAGAGTKRVLVTGFGRFLDTADNATGRIVAELAGVAYPETAPRAGQVDPPGPQTSVGTAQVRLDRSGDVTVCAMVLPVYWDLAAILVAKELDAFRPDFVLMNGVADEQQDLWLELGGVNRATELVDGSNVLVPAAPSDGSDAPILPELPATDARGFLLSWRPVHDAALAAVERAGAVVEGGVAMRELLPGVSYQPFPRDNDYLCNALAYTVSYLMGHPSETVELLRASTEPASAPNGAVATSLSGDFRATPRVFVHWASTLRGKHVQAGAGIVRDVIDAQLVALGAGPAEAPTVGDPALAAE